MEDNRAAKNTDKEIWRKVKDDYGSPSIHVTKEGSIGIDVGGFVMVAPVEKWHEVFKKNDEKKLIKVNIEIDNNPDWVKELMYKLIREMECQLQKK